MAWSRKDTLVAVIMLLCIGLCACSQVSKKPATKQTYDYLMETSQALQNENWDQAAESLLKLQSSWKKAKPRIQINQSAQHLDQFEDSLNRLEAFIQNKDKAQSQAEINSMVNSWKQLNDY